MKSSRYVETRSVDAPGWKPLLGHLDLELTERCNNKCVHCCINLPQNDRAAIKKELAAGDIKKILSEAVSLGCVSVRMTGGEPLIRQDFEEIYCYAREQKLRVILFTNATLIRPSLVRLFQRISPGEMIEVTDYGLTQTSYEAVTRVPGSFAAFRRGIDLLQRHKIPYFLKRSLLRQNKHEIKQLEDWVRRRKLPEVTYAAGQFYPRTRRDNLGDPIGCRLDNAEVLKVLARQKDVYWRDMQGFFARPVRIYGKSLFTCEAGLRSGCVDPYGFFHLCLSLRHPAMAWDLRTGSLKDALEKFFPKVRAVKAAHSEYLKKCARCFLKDFCNQCPAMSWGETGCLDVPVDYWCESTHTQARALGLLGPSEKTWEVSGWRKRIRDFIRSGQGAVA